MKTWPEKLRFSLGIGGIIALLVGVTGAEEKIVFAYFFSAFLTSIFHQLD